MADTRSPDVGTAPSAPPAGDPVADAPSGRGRRPWRTRTGLIGAGATVVLLLGLGALIEIGADARWWNPNDFPATSTMLRGVGDLLGDDQFWADFGRTVGEIAASMVGGALIGLLLGLLFWRLPTLGRVFEPYLVSFYAVPLVLFYPFMIVLVGINASSIIILATIMAAIPMALNTTVGLRQMPPVYLKLARSLRARPWQVLTQIALPAAAPYIVAGLRLAAVYALIGCVAMEFTTAQAGLGYRIRYLYEIFDNAAMFSYILVVLTLSVVLTAALAVAERLLVKGRTT